MASKQYYLAYLLRLWSDGARDGVGWRASLEHPHTGERLGFASLEWLFAFLEEQMAELTEEGGPRPDPRGPSDDRG